MIRALTIDELVKSLAELCKAEGVSLLVLTEREMTPGPVGEEGDFQWRVWQFLQGRLSEDLRDLAVQLRGLDDGSDELAELPLEDLTC